MGSVRWGGPMAKRIVRSHPPVVNSRRSPWCAGDTQDPDDAFVDYLSRCLETAACKSHCYRSPAQPRGTLQAGGPLRGDRPPHLAPFEVRPEPDRFRLRLGAAAAGGHGGTTPIAAPRPISTRPCRLWVRPTIPFATSAPVPVVAPPRNYGAPFAEIFERTTRFLQDRSAPVQSADCLAAISKRSQPHLRPYQSRRLWRSFLGGLRFIEAIFAKRSEGCCAALFVKEVSHVKALSGWVVWCAVVTVAGLTPTEVVRRSRQ